MNTRTQHHDDDVDEPTAPTHSNQRDHWYTTFPTATHLYATLHDQLTIYHTTEYTILQLDDTEHTLTIEREPLTLSNNPPRTATPTLHTLNNETRLTHPSPHDVLEAIGPITDQKHATPIDTDGVHLGIPTRTDTPIIIPNIYPIQSTTLADQEITTRIEHTIIQHVPACDICAIQHGDHDLSKNSEIRTDEPNLAINTNAETLQDFYIARACNNHTDQLPTTNTTHIIEATIEQTPSIPVPDTFTYHVESVTAAQ